MAIQDKFQKENHIYKITLDIDLGGGTLNIPANSTLDFQGGRIMNGTVVLNNTKILPNGMKVVDYLLTSNMGTYAEGQCLYSPSLGKPKWWTGEKWVDATGADV